MTCLFFYIWVIIAIVTAKFNYMFFNNFIFLQPVFFCDKRFICVKTQKTTDLALNFAKMTLYLNSLALENA